MPLADDGPVLEAWTTLAALAAQTTRVRLGTLISNVAFRHPAMLAKKAVTVHCISGGWLDIGVGTGEHSPEAARVLGLPFSTPRDRIDRLEEAVVVLNRLLRDRRLSYYGAYSQLEDALLVPAPVQLPRPLLVLAAEGTRALRVAAQHAAVWVTLLAGRGTRAEASQGVGGRASSGGEGRKSPSHRSRPYGTAWAGTRRPACAVSSSVSGARRPR